MTTTDSNSLRSLLTVAVAAGNLENFSGFCEQLSKAGLLNQPDVRICIAHTGKQPEDHDTGICLIHCPNGTPFFQLYETIIEQTDSLYIALLDAGCPPAEGWLEAARDQIKMAKDIFYGPVYSGWSADDPRIVSYLVEYAQFHSPLDQSLNEYPGNNIVFRRELLAKTPPEGPGFQKTFFIRRVERELGIKPDACNDMAIVYRKSYSWLYYLRRRLRHGRLYGSSNALLLGSRRFLYVIGTFILPLLRYWRILHAVRDHPILRRSSLHFSARILASEFAWSIGECQGYLSGAAQDEAYLD